MSRIHDDIESSVIYQEECSQNNLNRMIHVLIDDRTELTEENRILKRQLSDQDKIIIEKERKLVSCENKLAELGRSLDELKESSKVRRGTL
jgi:hypothetical protein